jgi:hypothetical protein
MNRGEILCRRTDIGSATQCLRLSLHRKRSEHENRRGPGNDKLTHELLLECVASRRNDRAKFSEKLVDVTGSSMGVTPAHSQFHHRVLPPHKSRK